jgi:hypothetical protein
MKARDFSNSNAPILRDSSGAHYVAPPVNGGAQVTKPVGSHGSQPNPAPPGSSSSVEPPTTPAPAPAAVDAHELEQLMASMVPAMRAASAPTDFDRLVGVCCNVLESEHAMSVLVHEAAADSGGVTLQRATSDALADAVVRFSDEVLRRAATLVDRREAPTQP